MILLILVDVSFFVTSVIGFFGRSFIIYFLCSLFFCNLQIDAISWRKISDVFCGSHYSQFRCV